MLLTVECKECGGRGIREIPDIEPFECFDCEGIGRIPRWYWKPFYSIKKRRKRKPEQDWQVMKRMLEVYAELEAKKRELRERELKSIKERANGETNGMAK